ncbi:MAG: RidA family protein [Dorea sp.]|jgi:enamine deaminase RidA (YjgF/YER057c/UK114 family)|nr:RidA family protein [Dorea sp.]
MSAEEKITELNIQLPPSSPPGAMYIPVKQTGNLLFVAGQVPFVDGVLAFTGKVGDRVTLEEARECARICIINMLAALKDYLGDLDKVKNVVKVQAFVNSQTGFQEQHIVINAASQLLYDVFGECGRHARTAVGTNQLPMDAPVEIEAIIEV